MNPNKTMPGLPSGGPSQATSGVYLTVNPDRSAIHFLKPFLSARKELARLFWKTHSNKSFELMLKISNKFMIVCLENKFDIFVHAYKFHKYCMNKISHQAIKYGN
jgi:hypothetical protein